MTPGVSAPPDWTSVLDRLRAQVASIPDALAVEARGATLTYAALALRVEAFAARLAPCMTTPETAVAVCLERTIDLPAWLLSIFARGGAYVPIDPSLPPARIAQVLAGANPAFILASESLIDRLPPTGIPLFVAETLAETPIAAAVPDTPICASSLAYVLFTSGSTGQPKGVEIEHGAITALIDAVALCPGLARGQTLLGLTRISFDISVLDIFLPLSGRCAPSPARYRRDGRLPADWRSHRAPPPRSGASDAGDVAGVDRIGLVRVRAGAHPQWRRSDVARSRRSPSAALPRSVERLWADRDDRLVDISSCDARHGRGPDRRTDRGHVRADPRQRAKRRSPMARSARSSSAARVWDAAIAVPPI